MSEIIYKYLPEERIGLIKEKGFFPNFALACKPPSYQNDPFECKITLKFNKKAYIEYLKNRNIEKIQIQGIVENQRYFSRKEIKKGIKEQVKEAQKDPNLEEKVKTKFLSLLEKNKDKWIGITSFSKKNDNECMWAHYASSHSGFVIGFNRDSEIFKIVDPEINGCGLRDVDYTDEPSVLEFGDLRYLTPPKWSYYRKKECWRYEDEVRFVVPLNILNGSDVFEFSPTVIDCIIFGAKMKNEYKMLIKDFCNKNDINHIKYYQASIPLESNSISINRL